MVLTIYKAITLILKYVKREENVCDYSIQHPYQDLLKVKQSTHYVNFVINDTTPMH